MDSKKALEKREKLIQYLQDLKSLLIAFSGGVDSSFLLAIAHQTLGDNVAAATADAIIYTGREIAEAKEFTAKRGISHIILPSDVTLMREFIENSPDRCYYCKRVLFSKMKKIAKDNALQYTAHAANTDDMKDFRPGQKAADEMGVIAPLVQAEMNKEEIRFLSKEMGLSTWDKPSMACLASRIPYGDFITENILTMISDAEDFLYSQGFRQYRVRYHKAVARIEVESSEINKIIEDNLRNLIIGTFREIGFHYIALDLEGFVSGSMNRVLDLGE